MKQRIGNFTVKEILPQIYSIGGEGVFRYLLVGEHHALLFDTGVGFSNLRECIEEITKLPLYIVNSHGHVDHAGANTQFDQSIYIHKADVPVYRKHQEIQARKIMMDSCKKMQKIFFFMSFFPRRFNEEKYLNGPLFSNFQYIKEGDIFNLGGMSAKVYELPGHTPGSVGLLCKERSVFFTSDAINRATWLFLPESCSLEVYKESLQKVMKLKFDYFLTGHENRLNPKNEIKAYYEVAENPDFENGKIQKENEFAPGVEVRRCTEKGNVKNKACLMISQDKIKG